MANQLTVSCIVLFALATTALAGANLGAGKVAVHVLPFASRTCSSNFPVIAGCGDIVTTEPSGIVDAFPVFYDLVEYAGVEYGLSWPGSYSCVFNTCADLSIGGIAWAGDGIAQSWDSCRPGPVCIPGWAFIYGSGQVCVTPHPGTGTIIIGDCSAELDQAIHSFCAGIGGHIGDDPCADAGIEPIDDSDDREVDTWGQIKTMFR